MFVTILGIQDTSAVIHIGLWILRENKKTGEFTKLQKSNNTFLIKQGDGIDIETIVITKKDVEQITKLIK